MTTHSNTRTSDHNRPRRTHGATLVSAVAAGLCFTVALSSPGHAAPTRANGNDRPTGCAPIVIGTGPKAVYVGPAPKVGGDPARGESDDSYFARTGNHLPGTSSAAVVDGPWWYGPAPVTGGDPAIGETDDSYFARTGRHLPGRWSAAVVDGSRETDDSYCARIARHLAEGCRSWSCPSHVSTPAG
jgi:hypothetical protein